MDLRDTKKVDYRSLNSGLSAHHESPHVHRDAEFLEDNNSDVIVADQDLVNHLDRSVREMEDELRILSLKEKSARLKLELKKKRTELQDLEAAALTESVNTTVSHAHPRPRLPDYEPAKTGMDFLQESKNPNPTRMGLDPQVYLVNKNVCKYRRIVDFVPSIPCDDVEEYDMGQFVMKLKNNSKPKRDAVSPALWIAANARILGEIVKETNSINTVMDYLSYTAKIGDYGTRYSWTSTFVYDDEYRKSQAQYGFRWGSDTPHVAQVFLREKERKPPKKTSGRRHDGKPYCYLLLRIQRRSR